MSGISRSALFGKLNSVAYKGIDNATTFCKLRGNPYVEFVHWLHQLLQEQDSDLHRIIQAFEIDPGNLLKDGIARLDALPRGATSISNFAPQIEESIERAWVAATLMFGESSVRTGHIVVGLMQTRGLDNMLPGISSEFAKINLEKLTRDYNDICGGSPEEALRAQDSSSLTGGVDPGESSGAMSSAEMGKQEALRKFTVDWTERARNGEMDPIVGRDEETRQVVDILMRRSQNNPILTGEAGVGKTAVVEGFAQRIAAGDVPPPLKNVSLLELDMARLQAGASMKGEFENRLKQVIEEVQSSEKPIILFVDEAHTLIGAGGAAGTGDAANLLKPALARGTLRTIAATTWAEYKKHIEKDPALTRRFQVVKVEEPEEARAILMMRRMAGVMEQHHRVQLLDEAIEASVHLSHRYIPARQLPDKSKSLLDTACARVAIGLHSIPPEVEDTQSRIMALETEMAIIEREKNVGVDTAEREARVRAELDEEATKLADLEVRWDQEKQLVDKILNVKAQLQPDPDEDLAEKMAGDIEAEGGETSEAAPADTEKSADAEPEIDREALLAELTSLQDELETLQGETPLILPNVGEQAVASVVADWTGIPVGRMVKDEIETVLNLPEILKERIIGQDHSLEMIARRIQTSRAGLDNPGKPIGVFMLAGSSGVGKTETAVALAETLYGGEENMVVLNMSEFQEAHTVSTLKGAPPGYIGYGEGGVLTEAVRRRPFSVVLLDEVEKAHPDIHKLFLQVFDKGVMEDGEGREIDFRNTLILLTTNVGADLVMNMCSDPELMPEPDGIAKALREPLLKVFAPEFLGRLVVIPYYPLTDKIIGTIAKLQLGRISKRITEQHEVPFTYDDAVLDLIISRCTELESGGRVIDSILTNTLLPSISTEILTCLMEGREFSKVAVSVKDDEFEYAFN
jgi:type VI secretion system protein VasG